MSIFILDVAPTEEKVLGSSLHTRARGSLAAFIEQIGEGVTNVKVGDRVAFCLGSGFSGSYAQAIIAPASELIPLPDDLSFEEGAAFPLQGMTAHYLLHEFYKLQPGDSVLIHAAAGGMGQLLC